MPKDDETTTQRQSSPKRGDTRLAQVRDISPRGTRGDVAKPWVTKEKIPHLAAAGLRETQWSALKQCLLSVA